MKAWNWKKWFVVFLVIAIVVVAVGVDKFLQTQIVVISVDDGAKVRTDTFLSVVPIPLGSVPDGTVVTVRNQSMFDAQIGVDNEMGIRVDGKAGFPLVVSGEGGKLWVQVPAGKTLTFSLGRSPEKAPCLPAPTPPPGEPA